LRICIRSLVVTEAIVVQNSATCKGEIYANKPQGWIDVSSVITHSGASPYTVM